MRAFLFAALLGTAALTGPTAAAQNHFTTCANNTGSNATFILPLSSAPQIGGESLASGDEFAVFTADGLCAGAAVWNGENAALTIWGDDVVTEDKDGLDPNEALTFRVWDASTGVEYAAENAQIHVSLDDSQPFYRTESTYQDGGIYVFASFQVEPAPGAGALEQVAFPANYPNPFSSQTTIPFHLPEAGHVSLKVYNVLGQEVATLLSETRTVGSHAVQWTPEDLPSGLYFCRLKAGPVTLTRTISIVR